MPYSRKAICNEFLLKGTILERVRSTSDMGFLFDVELTFNLNIDVIINKARRKVRFIFCFTKYLKDEDMFKLLY